MKVSWLTVIRWKIYIELVPVNSQTQQANFDTVQAVALKSQGLNNRQIAETLGASYDAVRQWLRRNFVSHRVAKAKVSAVQKLQPKELESVGDKTKAILSAEVLGQSEELSQCVLPIGNKDGTQGKAAILKTLVESADKLFGWSESTGEVQIHFHALGARPASVQSPASDSQSEQKPQVIDVEQVS